MRVEEIKDADSLQAWLESLPQETEDERETTRRCAVTIAHRAAMRVLPVYWRSTMGSNSRNRGSTALPVLQCNLIPSVAGSVKGPEIRVSSAITKAAAAAAVARAFTEYFSPASAAADASAYAAAATTDAAAASTSAKRAAAATAMYAFPVDTDMWDIISKDLAVFRKGYALDRVPLWQDNNELTQFWDDTKPKILAQSDGWRFWVEWYENALYGRPQDYDLLTKIALIDPADWDKGAEHVNALIQRIVEQHTLAKDARALKEEIAHLKQRLQSVEHRSHNNPPELVDETLAAQKEVTIIWAALDEAEQELEKPNPNPSVLARIGAFLKTASVTIAQYCGALADLAVKTSVRTAAATGTAMALASQSEQLRAFGEALLQFAKSLGAP